MQDKELVELWKSYDHKMDQVLSINQELVKEMTKSKLNKTIGRLRKPKTLMLFIGIPYTIILFAITLLAFFGGAIFVAIGFGAIALIMTITISLYGYQLHLIDQINGSNEIRYVQEKLSKLKLSSFNCARISIIQLPFWSICWMSFDALLQSPLIYGGVNILVFVGLSYLAYWLYHEMSLEKTNSKVRQFFLSGLEWDPIIKSSNIINQLADFK